MERLRKELQQRQRRRFCKKRETATANENDYSKANSSAPTATTATTTTTNRLKPLQQRLYCRDGFRVSIQASAHHACTPRDDTGPYTTVEVGYPSKHEPLLIPFLDEFCADIYNHVPAQIIRQLIHAHGGLAFNSGDPPPLERQDEDGVLYAAALPAELLPETEEEDRDDDSAHTFIAPVTQQPKTAEDMFDLGDAVIHVNQYDVAEDEAPQRTSLTPTQTQPDTSIFFGSPMILGHRQLTHCSPCSDTEDLSEILKLPQINS